MTERQIALRTYATQAEAFKRSFSYHAINDQAAVETVRQLQLPRFIWVVELMEREKSKDAETGSEIQRRVVGEFILDATSNDLEPMILFAHLPGVLVIERRRDQGDGLRICDPDLKYYTSRPSYLPGAIELIGQSKSAIAGGSYV
jgi:hypothetical protein